MNVYNKQSFEVFSNTYLETLTEEVSNHPEKYPWAGKISIETVHDRMIKAITNSGVRGVNIDGAIAKTAKKLTGKATKKALEAFLTGGIFLDTNDDRSRCDAVANALEVK